MKALARPPTFAAGSIATATASSFTSGASVGGGSNAGSTSVPSPELRPSPQGPQGNNNPNPGSALSPSDWSFPMTGGAEGGGSVGGGSGGGTPRLGADPPTRRAVPLMSGDVQVELSGVNLSGGGGCGDDDSGTARSSGAAAVAAASEAGGLPPPAADADSWVASALSSAGGIVGEGDGSP